MNFRERHKKRSMILNVTSLVDVLFLTLIFLLVTTTFGHSPAVTVTLPRSATAEETVDTPSIVYLTVDGHVYLNQQPVVEKDLPAMLVRLRSDTGEDRMVLRADAGAAHGDVVRLIDIIKQSGFTRISLSARAAGAE